MNKLKDLTGQRFGKLTVIERAPLNSATNQVQWICICDCGKKTIVRGNSLKQGNTQSCGCLLRETRTAGNYKHGQSTTALYMKWCGIKEVCSNPNHVSHFFYQKKGITVCDEWEYSFIAFRDWAIANGYKEGMALLRKDKSGPFSPENCYFEERRRREVMNHGKE